MIGRPFRRSTRALVAGLILSLVAVVWGEVIKDALEHAEEYFDAKAAIETNGTVDHLVQAGQNLAFERGRTNVVLHRPDPVGDDDRRFLDTRRRAVDEHLAEALRGLEAANPSIAAPLKDRLRDIRQLRGQVDQALAVPLQDRNRHLTDRWFPTASGMLDEIQGAMAAISLGSAHASPQFRIYSRIKMLAFDLRDSLGVESSRIAANIAAQAPLDIAAAAEIMRLRGESAAHWQALAREVSFTRDPTLAQAMADVESKFFRDFRPLQESVLAAILTGRRSPVPVGDYTRASVPALTSVTNLIDVASARTALLTEADAHHARTSMLVYGGLAAVALILGLVTILTVSGRLLRPLGLFQAQLQRLARGESTLDLPRMHRNDEMGDIQTALEALQDAQTERQRIADELAQQTERLSTLINAMPDFVCFKDGKGRWLVVNDYGRSLFGLDAVDYLGKTDLELSQLSDGCRQTLCGCVDTDLRAWEKRSPSRGEEVVTGSDGKVYIFDVVKVPLFGSGDSRRGLVVVGRDITERRRIEAALARLSRQNELILEAAGEGIIGIDPAGDTIFANPAAARMTGWELGDLLGQSHHQLVHHTRADGSPHPAEDCPVALTLADGQPRHVLDDVFWRKDGTCFPVEFTADAIVEQGTVRGAVIVFRDIGERKRTAAEIEALLADLRRSNADLEQFAYAVSHDLQEPLRMVASYLQMLRRRYAGKLDSDADEFIDFAVDGSKRMSVMINALLEFARVGTRGAEPEPLDMGVPVTQALANLSAAIEESGARVTVAEPLPRVLGDEAQLTSLMQNLVGNAIKYRRPDVSPVIRIEGGRKGGICEFRVIDNGMGIPPGDRERVFGVFQRLGARPDATGTGMGLAICKRIIERLGGSIRITDAEDGGSCFVFRLPAG